jgi:transcriptional regulator of heat shock response
MEPFTFSKSKVLFASTGSIIALVGAMFTVDARYAHAADVDTQNTKTQQLIQETSKILRSQMIEDKLFELDLKKAQDKNQRLSPIDSALYERYQRQLNQLKK